MPIIETTLIAGYEPAVKQRLVTALTRAVRSVVDADPAAVIVVLREVDASCWARGGVSRQPGPPLPAAIDVVKAHAVASGRSYDAFHEAYGDDGSLVFAEGHGAEGAAIIDRYTVRAGAVVAVASWGDH